VAALPALPPGVIRIKRTAAERKGKRKIKDSGQCTPSTLRSILRDPRRSKRLRGELGNASSLRSTADLKDAKALLDELNQ
jgi:hypothetical protein